MKILFASSSSGSRGGGETFLVYLGEALAAQGHEVLLWTSNHPRMDETAARFANFGTVHRAQYTNTYDRPRRSLAALLDRKTPARAAAEWSALAPDIIHINKQNLEDGLDLLHAARLVSIPTLCTIHITQDAKFLHAKGAPLRDWVARRGLRSYRDPFVTVSEPRKTDLQHFLRKPRQIAAIPNGVPIPTPLPDSERTRHRLELGLAPDDLAILAVGRMTAQKRPLLFLEHASEIAAEMPNAKFLWIGDGPLAAEFDAKATALNLTSRIQRLGWRDDATSLLACGDLLLHTAEYEGMPLAILEAMAVGLPCAVSDSLRRELPFLDATNSITPDKIPSDPILLQRLGQSARALAVKSFSTAKMSTSYQELYLQLMKKKD
jgi:glycosyltransferase involved in cell wall biosynthesis